MVTIVSKLKVRRAFDLAVAIPLLGSDPKEVEVDGKKLLRHQTERVLTLGPGEKRSGLPDSILSSPQIETAVKNGWVLVKAEAKHGEEKTKTEEAQPFAASLKKPKKTEE